MALGEDMRAWLLDQVQVGTTLCLDFSHNSVLTCVHSLNYNVCSSFWQEVYDILQPAQWKDYKPSIAQLDSGVRVSISLVHLQHYFVSHSLSLPTLCDWLSLYHSSCCRESWTNWWPKRQKYSSMDLLFVLEGKMTGLSCLVTQEKSSRVAKGGQQREASHKPGT